MNGLGLGLSLGLKTGGGGDLFTPASLTTAQALWFDADYAPSLFQSWDGTVPATADGETIGYWGDRSANARNVIQVTSANRPALKLAVQNGRNVIRFDGVDDVLANATPILTASGQYTIYLVYRGLAASAGGSAFQNGGTGDGFGVGFGTAGGIMSTPSDHLAGAKQGVSWSPTGLLHNTLGVLTATYDGSGATGDTTYRRDGVDGTSAGGGKILDATDGTFIGAGSAASLFITGDLCEFLLYTVKHDAATISLFESYLRTKWGMP